MPRKTVAEIAIDVLAENDTKNIWWGDCGYLDEIGIRATHTNLSSLHPLTRHTRILDALERSGRFEKYYITLGEKKGQKRMRCLTLKPQVEE